MKRLLKFESYLTDARRYKHKSASMVVTEKMMLKNSSETILEKKYVHKGFDNTGHVFHIKTLSETFGKESATEKITKDMNSLVKDIDVITDENGKLKQIYNMSDVIKRWATVKKKWKKEATQKTKEQINKAIETIETNLKNGSFIDDVANQGPLYFLLNGLYGNYDDKEPKLVKRELNKFLVSQSLPLIITYRVTDYNQITNEIVIEGLGEVDQDRLDLKSLAQLIRALKDQINAKVELQVAYKERFEFDSYHWLKKGEQEIQVKIPGFYRVDSKQSITQLEKDG